MSVYSSVYTGAQIDSLLGAVNTAVTADGIVNINGLNTILGDYLTTSDAASTYQTPVQVQAAIEQAIAATKLAMFPIGSIYMSTVNTNPGTFIGGTWQAIEGRFLLAANSTYTAGSTGGQTSIQHTHNYGIAFGGYYYNISIEGNSVNSGVLTYDTSNNESTSKYTSVGSMGAVSYNGSTTSSGASYDSAQYRARGNTSYTTISTMPPYLAVYMWKRTA